MSGTATGVVTSERGIPRVIVNQEQHATRRYDWHFYVMLVRGQPRMRLCRFIVCERQSKRHAWRVVRSVDVATPQCVETNGVPYPQSVRDKAVEILCAQVGVDP